GTGTAGRRARTAKGLRTSQGTRDARFCGRASLRNPPNAEASVANDSRFFQEKPGKNRGLTPGQTPAVRVLLDLDGGAGLLELGFDRVGLVLGDGLLDRLGRRVDEVLRLLQAEARDRAHDLDHLDLLAAGVREDDVELGLLLGGRAVTAWSGCAGRGDRDGSCGRDPPLVLDLFLQLDEIEHGHLPEL